MGLKVEELREFHPLDLKQSSLVKIVDKSAGFFLNEYAIVTGDPKQPLVTLRGTILCENYKISPLPNGTRLVVTDNEGGA